MRQAFCEGAPGRESADGNRATPSNKKDLGVSQGPFYLCSGYPRDNPMRRTESANHLPVLPLSASIFTLVPVAISRNDQVVAAVYRVPGLVRVQ